MHSWEDEHDFYAFPFIQAKKMWLAIMQFEEEEHDVYAVQFNQAKVEVFNVDSVLVSIEDLKEGLFLLRMVDLCGRVVQICSMILDEAIFQFVKYR